MGDNALLPSSSLPPHTRPLLAGRIEALMQVSTPILMGALMVSITRRIIETKLESNDRWYWPVRFWNHYRWARSLATAISQPCCIPAEQASSAP
jgi:hypothetical protein